MRFTVETIGIWLSQFDAWLAIALGILFVVLAIAIGIIPVKMIKHFDEMDLRLCKAGAIKSPMGSWPAWTSFAAALWVAIPGAFAVFRKHLQTQDVWQNSIFYAIGFDFSDPVPRSLLFGLWEVSIPSDFALYFDRFEKLWFVPMLAVAAVFLLRVSKFRSAHAATSFLAGQLLLVNAIYWVYGGYLMFVFVPVIAAFIFFLFGAISGGSKSSASRREQSRSPSAGGETETSSSETSASNSGIAVESQDMFDTELRHKRSLGPDQHLELDEERSSTYGRVYVDRDTGKSYTETDSDSFNHPTEVRENFL